MARHYLDHASTSPARPEVVDAMLPWLRGAAPDAPGIGAGDPGRIHTEGMHARHAVEVAREQVAAMLGARSREVVFTSGATESIAAAIHGASERGTDLVVPAIEHSAVRLAAQRLADAGTHHVTVVDVDDQAHLDPEAVACEIGDATGLVAIQWGNHEVGTAQDVAKIVEACRARRHDVLVHVDAAAAVGHVPVDFTAIDADLLSVAAHKFGGPPGIGVLLVRRGVRLSPLLVGGDQERARRAGYENVPAIVGLGAAAALLTPERIAAEGAEQRRRTDRVLDAAATIQGVRIYGDPVRRVPHIVCLGVDGVEPQAILLGLDQAGVAAHSGSACSSESLEPSPVLEAMGVDAHHSLRVSVGWPTTDADIDALLEHLPLVIARMRALAGD